MYRDQGYRTTCAQQHDGKTWQRGRSSLWVFAILIADVWGLLVIIPDINAWGTGVGPVVALVDARLDSVERRKETGGYRLRQD